MMGCVVKGKETWVYKLNKALYGLRQSAVQWNLKLNQLMNGLGFRRSLSDQCFYFKWIDEGLCIIVVYLDDLLIAAPNLEAVNKIKNDLRKFDEHSDKGEVKHFLNLDIDYQRELKKLYISQPHYIQQLLNDTNMNDCNGTKTPVVPGTQG